MPALLVTFLVLGALGLFLALPGGRRCSNLLGWLLLAAGGACVVALLVWLISGGAELGWSIGLGLVGLYAALRVITHQKPVYSALYFVLLIVAVTGLLVLMEAHFLAVALVMVYAGAILVTYVFVIMLAQRPDPAVYDIRAREPLWGAFTGFLLLALVSGRLFTGGEPAAAEALEPALGPSGTVEAVGTLLLTQYIVAIQLVGVLLLAAMVGAIAIARRQVRPEADQSDIAEVAR